MTKTFLSVMAFAAAVSLAPAAFASTDAEDRARAIGVCRTAIADAAQVDATEEAVAFHRGQTRGGWVKVDFRVRIDGETTKSAECVVARRDMTIARLKLDGQNVVTAPTATAQR